MATKEYCMPVRFCSLELSQLGSIEGSSLRCIFNSSLSQLLKYVKDNVTIRNCFVKNTTMAESLITCHKIQIKQNNPIQYPYLKEILLTICCLWNKFLLDLLQSSVNIEYSKEELYSFFLGSMFWDPIANYDPTYWTTSFFRTVYC